ncbi:MAG TPA: hypothetical protein VFM88_23175 [Vicinamibacteria bacterium]|nr:hypothetical protein [Vicinamibacteria bacterium]
MKRALEQNPSSATAYEEYTNVLTAQGQRELVRRVLPAAAG